MLPVIGDTEDVKKGGKICAAIEAQNLLYKLQVFQSRHGFVPRGDLSDPVINEEVEEVMGIISTFIRDQFN